MSAFEEVGVSPELIRAVEELGWTLPTPIQAEAVPLILGGGDVMAAAETGSGKTGAFALPVLQIVHEALRTRQRARDSAATASAAGAAPAPAGPPPCVLNAEDRDAVVAVAPDGLRCQARSEQAWGGVRGTLGAFGGRVYYEATVADEGLCRVGWATQAATLDVGTDKQSFGFGGTGKKSHNRSFNDYGEAYGLNDTIGCMLDCEGRSLAFTKNGQPLGQAFELPQHLQGQALYPAICLKNAELAVNFGAAPFKHGPPPGFVGLAAAPPASTASWQAALSALGVAGTDRKPLAIILEPARDLAEQTHDNVTLFGKHLSAPGLRNALLIGGTNPQAQLRALGEGVDIVVGTPGRVMDFIESGKLATDQVKFFVLDEADRLLDTGNQDLILKMFRRFPKAGAGVARLQVLLFSATLHSPEVRALAAQICQNPILVDLKGKDAVPETVDHVLVSLDPREDRSWLQSQPPVFTDKCHALDKTGTDLDTPENWSEAVKRLKQRYLQRVIDAFGMDQCLIFCRTNLDCDNLEHFMNALGGGAGFTGKRESGRENAYSCLVLAGQRTMDERRAALQAFKDGDVRFLICTDVAARGLDIQGLPYVINMTLPDRPEDYIHRVGRVGRADTMGLAISLVSAVPEKVWFCTQKGYKPWLAPDATNTRTNEQGGQTTWYDEPALLKEVEQRLSRPIPALTPDLSLPPEIASRVAGTQAGSGGGAQYGQQRGGGVSADVMERVAAVRPAVAELARLEHQAQASFYALKRKWAALA